ncbi:caspase-8-like [Gigantopelta aegis]|uniref:caspase-8-like n=1 Tax=Gigantopelta aegis TaxID=1735272 RepID=UPI001B88A7C1|nr:caspase-8-like [Gigantopelta aegis]
MLKNNVEEDSTTPGILSRFVNVSKRYLGKAAVAVAEEAAQVVREKFGEPSSRDQDYYKMEATPRATEPAQVVRETLGEPSSHDQNYYTMEATPRATEPAQVVRETLGEPSSHDQDYYKMDANPRGMCIIINNRDFYYDPSDSGCRNLGQRNGKRKLEETFEKLGFFVSTHENLTDKEMKDTAETVGKMDHDTFDCLAFCVLSHGKEGEIYGSKGRAVNMSELTGPFKSQRCPSLAGKPKLFFIQACQGRRTQGGRRVQTDSQPFQDENVTRGNNVIPEDVDFLIAYATVPGCVSYRSTQKGSWFIYHLTKILNE